MRIAGHRARFRLGERIPVELEFTAGAPDRFRLDTALYDYSGRVNLDRFQAVPLEEPRDSSAPARDLRTDEQPPVVDPLADYFGSHLLPMAGGGLRQELTLGAEPVVVRGDLNEWLRFDAPGRYRVQVTSDRVSDSQNTPPRAVPLTSNPVALEIVASEAEWQAEQLRAATRTLDGAASEEEKREAVRALRYLGTDAAVTAMVRRFAHAPADLRNEYFLGLVAAPQRRFVAEEMERTLRGPQRPVEDRFLRALAFLALLVRHPHPMPPYPARDAAAQQLWSETLNTRRKQLDSLYERYAQQNR